MKRRLPFIILFALSLVAMWAGVAFAQDAAGSAQQPSISLSLDTGEGGYVAALKILLLIGALSFAPALLLATTSFTRIVIVLSLMRQAVGVVQLPPTKVLVGLALFLTFFTMTPTFSEVNKRAIEPYQAGEMTEEDAFKEALIPMRSFMLRHTREKDLALFLDLMGEDRPNTVAEVSTLAVIPAFMLSELKTAFQMGALLFIPFLVIDMVVASVLMSMGMMMLPPMTIALPLKLIIFVAVDGWGLLIASLGESLL
jgi:flagellar biosynthesis protein FliP